MNVLSLNSGCVCDSNLNKDLLSGFKRHSEKEMSIRPGMTINEISDVVSDRIMNVVKEQFEKSEQEYKAMKSDQHPKVQHI